MEHARFGNGLTLLGDLMPIGSAAAGVNKPIPQNTCSIFFASGKGMVTSAMRNTGPGGSKKLPLTEAVLPIIADIFEAEGRRTGKEIYDRFLEILQENEEREAEGEELLDERIDEALIKEIENHQKYTPAAFFTQQITRATFLREYR